MGFSKVCETFGAAFERCDSFEYCTSIKDSTAHLLFISSEQFYADC